jgi:hypothetical protein
MHFRNNLFNTYKVDLTLLYRGTSKNTLLQICLKKWSFGAGQGKLEKRRFRSR